MGEKAAKVENFGAYLSEVVRSSQDRVLLQLAAQVVGHLVRSNVQLTAALVDGEVTAPFFASDLPETHEQDGMRTLLLPITTWLGNCRSCRISDVISMRM